MTLDPEGDLQWRNYPDDYDSASARGGVGSWQHDTTQVQKSNWKDIQKRLREQEGAYRGTIDGRVDDLMTNGYIDWDKVYSRNPFDPNAVEQPSRLNTGPVRSQVLYKAEELINGDRQSDYGPPEENFDRIAHIWSVIFGIEVSMAQVAQAMAGVKLARLVETPDHRDTYTDLAGYAALGAELAEIDRFNTLPANTPMKQDKE